MFPAETIFFLMTGAALAGIVMGLVGFGTGLAALGFWLFVVEPTLAVPLVGVCSLTTTAFTLKAYKHAIRLDRLAPFFLGAVFGLPIGVILLTRMDPAIFKLAMGLFLIVYTLFRLFVMPGLTFRTGSRLADIGVGVGSGVLSGFAAIPGPLTTVWSGLRGWSKDEQRGVYQPFNQIMILVAMIGFGMEGLLTRDLGIASLYCVPAALVGMGLGMMGYKRMDEVQFARVVLLLLLVSGLMLVILNAIAMLTQ
ncbi:MAG: sulfite exporter TauE/SafE family protein [Hyphomicrobiales bacterium]|nr:sulfite exporter TauE/SafE family protein [Hyphomicrobiales bacterium]